MITRNRSTQKEFLDQDNIPFDDIRLNMKELDIINTWLGGHAATLTGLRKLLKIYNRSNKPLHICEMGCGGGDNLRVIHQWSLRNNIDVQLTGIDKNEACIGYAADKNPERYFTWIRSDYAAVEFGEKKPDILFSSLFCHHFSNRELVFMMKWMRNNCRIGFFINDLHRNKIAYYSIQLLTKFFSNSYLVKHDAPLSVLRGMTRREWDNIMSQAGILHFDIKWKWAYRWLITVYP